MTFPLIATMSEKPAPFLTSFRGILIYIILLKYQYIYVFFSYYISFLFGTNLEAHKLSDDELAASINDVSKMRKLYLTTYFVMLVLVGFGLLTALVL